MNAARKGGGSPKGLTPHAGINSSVEHARPFVGDIFHGRAPLRYQLEVDWEVAHPFGSFLLGATGGFWQNYGRGLFPKSGQPSEDRQVINTALVCISCSEKGLPKPLHANHPICRPFLH